MALASGDVAGWDMARVLRSAPWRTRGGGAGGIGVGSGLAPGGGAALYAAKLSGMPLTASAIAELTRQLNAAGPAAIPT